ncbi:MAG: o-succinylbenzoate--CoA ligase [Myxococcota bacterium]
MITVYPPAIHVVTGEVPPESTLCQALHAANQLRRVLGIRPGQRVGLYGNNAVLFTMALLGCWQAGAVAVLCPTREPWKVLLPWLRGMGCVRLLYNTINMSDGPPKELVKALHPRLHVTWFPLLSQGAENQKPDQPLLPEQRWKAPATILRTSGTTARPKSVVHTLAHHLHSAAAAVEHVRFGPGDRWMLSLPLYHVGGLAILCRALVSGGSLALARPEELRLSIPLLAHLRVTHLSLVPTQLLRLLQEREAVRVLRGMKAILLGGGPLPQDLLRQAAAHKLPIVTTYGCTEAASQVTAGALPLPEAGPWTSGSVLPGRQLRVGADGEIAVRGKTLFCGYALSRGKLDRARGEDDWFVTGDLGQLDEQGNLHVVGRKDNRIVSGGENIQAEEVEAALRLHPGVHEAAVLPQPSEEFGQRPVAFVQFVLGNVPPPVAALREHLAQHLARFKIPDAFLPWPSHVPSDGLKEARRLLRHHLMENR